VNREQFAQDQISTLVRRLKGAPKTTKPKEEVEELLAEMVRWGEAFYAPVRKDWIPCE